MRESPQKSNQWANAERVLKDIESGCVFDDIQLEFDQVLSKSLAGRVSSDADFEEVIDQLKGYYGELCQVVERRYDQVKVILESYFRQQIQIKRDRLMEEEDCEDGDSIFAGIADLHNEKLGLLREGF